jgi:high affinity sulfate transporter 1
MPPEADDEEGHEERQSPPGTRLRGALPILDWLRGYRPEWARADAIAGVTLAAYAVPVSLAYATIAGLPPERGLYGYLFAAVYCLFGTSRQLALGPTSAISLVVGTAIAEQAPGDVERAAAIGSLAALLVGAITVAAWLLRLGSVVNFVSETVLAGFKVGAALVIASTQLPKLFGLAAQGDGFFARMANLARDLPGTHPWALAVGGGALLLILLSERILPNRPVVLGVVVLSILATALLDLEARGVRVVGALPEGIPVPSLPGVRLRDVDGLLLVALACFLLAYVEGSSVARTFALRNRYRVDPDQELLALGAANLAVGLGHGYPVAGGMSQSAVNASAGARTPLALVAASLAIAAVLLLAADLTRNLPEPLLAAVVLGAVRGLFDPAELVFLWRASRPEFRVALVALAGVLALGVLRGVIVAAILSLLTLIRRAERPPMAALGRIPGSDRFRNLENHPEAERTPGVLVFRVEGALVYFNAEHVRAELLHHVDEAPEPVRRVVFELAAVPHLDLAGARLLATLRDELAARGADLRLAEARRSVRQTLRRAGVEQGLGALDRRRSIAELLER